MCYGSPDTATHYTETSVGECLEALYGADAQVAGQLALHFCEANEFTKAIHYAQLAMEFEQSRYAWAEAERWLEFGLGILEKVPSMGERTLLQIKFLELSGYGYNVCGQYALANQRYREVLNLVPPLPEYASQRASAYGMLADICDELNQLDEMSKFVEFGKQSISQFAVTDELIQLEIAIPSPLCGVDSAQ